VGLCALVPDYRLFWSLVGFLDLCLWDWMGLLGMILMLALRAFCIRFIPRFLRALEVGIFDFGNISFLGLKYIY
jgi:hypothetical protein